jgi:metal-dependent hydrolase (beta-lactamase superfamily II)
MRYGCSDSSAENTANYGYFAEWGLSVLTEADQVTILMEAGFSFSAVQNAQLMGIDPPKIDNRANTANKPGRPILLA